MERKKGNKNNDEYPFSLYWFSYLSWIFPYITTHDNTYRKTLYCVSSCRSPQPDTALGPYSTIWLLLVPHNYTTPENNENTILPYLSPLPPENPKHKHGSDITAFLTVIPPRPRSRNLLFILPSGLFTGHEYDVIPAGFRDPLFPFIKLQASGQSYLPAHVAKLRLTLDEDNDGVFLFSYFLSGVN